MSIEKTYFHENEAEYGRAEYKKSFTKNESAITFDVEVELKRNFQDFSLIKFEIVFFEIVCYFFRLFTFITDRDTFFKILLR